MRHFILLLTNFRDQIEPYLEENKQNKTKQKATLWVRIVV